jgi:hypothetical protein
VRQFYHAEIEHLDGAPAMRTFHQWLSHGAKFARIAAGGSVYSLLILCGLNLRSAISRVHGTVPYDVATILRRPQLAGSGEFRLSFVITELIDILRVAAAHRFQDHPNNSTNARRATAHAGN